MSDVSEVYPKQITLGDAVYAIHRFKGLKAAIASAILSRVLTELPELQDKAAEFRKEFRKKNTIEVTPAMAKLPRFSVLGLEREDFEMAGGNIELPEEPDNGTVFIHMFPQLLTLARKELEKFLALLVIPNSELEAADDADEVDMVLASKGKLIMRQGDIDQIMELVILGRDVFRDQLSSSVAGKRLGELLPGLFRMIVTEAPAEQSDGLGQIPLIPDDEIPSPSTSSAPPSPTDSLFDSDGIEEPLSTESPGTS